MMEWSLFPVWTVDFFGSAAMILVSALCVAKAYENSKKNPDSPLAAYILWFSMALFAFSASRSIGHMVKYVLLYIGRGDLWHRLSPISGSINTIAFVGISSVTLFFHRMQKIMERMERDRIKIEKTTKELLKLNEDIEAVVSQRTKSELALRIAHRIRNPVMIIGGLIRQLMKKGREDEEYYQHHLEKILEQAKKLESLVSTFENLRASTQETFVDIDLNELAQEAIEVISPEAEKKGIVLVFERAAKPLTFRGSPHLLKIALLHIIRNALEACKHGDSIEITTGIEGGRLFLEVKDNGPGIPPEILKHILKAFYTTKEGKTGLGLPYVNQIIREHRGELKVNSVQGKGTTVRIYLPTHGPELDTEDQ